MCPLQKVDRAKRTSQQQVRPSIDRQMGLPSSKSCPNVHNRSAVDPESHLRHSPKKLALRRYKPSDLPRSAGRFDNSNLRHKYRSPQSRRNLCWNNVSDLSTTSSWSPCSNATKAPPKFIVLPDKPKRFRRVFHRPPTKPTSSKLEAHVLIAMGSAAKLSGRAKATQAKELARQYEAGATTVAAPGAAVVRRDQTVLNKTFLYHFSPMDCSHSKDDGGIVFCNDTVDWLYLLCWLRHKSVKDIKLIKINGDDGRGSLKLMIQFLFANDPLFTADPLTTRQNAPDENNGLLDSGVDRVYILSLICGASESFESIRALFNAVDLSSLLKECGNATFIFPVDMKFSKIMVGLQPHGALKSYLWDEWSPYEDASKPNRTRSIESIEADGRRYITAEAKDSSIHVDPRNFNSTEQVPIQLLLDFIQLQLINVFPPPQLHLLLGITKSLFKFLENLAMSLANDWLAKIKVRRSERHGATDFTGNDCRRIIRSTAQLRQLPDFPKHLSRASSGIYNNTILLLTTAFADFSRVVAHTMRLQLNPNWSTSLATFKSSYAEFVTSYNIIFEPAAGRSKGRWSPKLRCLFVQVPQWINAHKQSLSAVSEQPFETLHYRFLSHILKYPKPKTGEEREAGRRRQTSSPNFVRASRSKNVSSSHTPSSGTRSGQTLRKRKIQQVSSDKENSPFPPRKKRIIGNITRARQINIQAVASFNSNNLPLQFCVQTRQKSAVRTLQAEHSPPKDRFESVNK